MPVVRELMPCEAHIRYIVNNLRERDRVEIMALRWDDNLDNLAQEITAVAGAMWRVFTVDDEPAAVAGLTPLRPGVIAGGAFGTSKWRYTVKAIMRWGRDWATPRILAAGYHRGEVYALASNTDSRKFIEAMGGEIEAVLRGYGRNKEDFLLYAWRFDDVHRFNTKAPGRPDDDDIHQKRRDKSGSRHRPNPRSH